jgi:predicted SAM-dependent methyltransferase
MKKSNENLQKDLYLSYEGTYQGQKNAKMLLSLVKSRLHEPILDIGAGDGSLMIRLKALGRNAVEGIDLAPAVDFVREGSITELPYPSKSFRTIFCTEVIEHLDKEQSIAGLEEVFRVLQPGGVIVATVPDREVMARNNVVCPYCNNGFHRYGHHQAFDKEKICALFAKCGFKVKVVNAYALGAMSVVPFGRFFNFLFKKLNFESVAITLVIVAEKPQ